jgi:hypothetical protein
MRTARQLGAATALTILVLAVFAPFSGASRSGEPCTGAVLTGTFRAVPNSEGAGNIVYKLRLVDSSSQPCFVTGIPGLTLLDASGKKLPTNARFGGRPGTLSAVMVPLTTGHAAGLTARFSPDVPGPGEPVLKNACERTAYKLRVAPSGGGTVVVPIKPPTPVCEHGTLSLTVFTHSA